MNAPGVPCAVEDSQEESVEDWAVAPSAEDQHFPSHSPNDDDQDQRFRPLLNADQSNHWRDSLVK